MFSPLNHRNWRVNENRTGISYDKKNKNFSSLITKILFYDEDDEVDDEVENLEEEVPEE